MYAVKNVGILTGLNGFLAKFLSEFAVVAVDASLLELENGTDTLLK